MGLRSCSFHDISVLRSLTLRIMSHRGCNISRFWTEVALVLVLVSFVKIQCHRGHPS